MEESSKCFRLATFLTDCHSLSIAGSIILERTKTTRLSYSRVTGSLGFTFLWHSNAQTDPQMFCSIRTTTFHSTPQQFRGKFSASQMDFLRLNHCWKLAIFTKTIWGNTIWTFRTRRKTTRCKLCYDGFSEVWIKTVVGKSHRKTLETPLETPGLWKLFNHQKNAEQNIKRTLNR